MRGSLADGSARHMRISAGLTGGSGGVVTFERVRSDAGPDRVHGAGERLVRRSSRGARPGPGHGEGVIPTRARRELRISNADDVIVGKVDDGIAAGEVDDGIVKAAAPAAVLDPVPFAG